MPPKFRKLTTYNEISQAAETEVLDEYAAVLDNAQAEDVLLSDVPAILSQLKIPGCFTDDIQNCIQWFYDTGRGHIQRGNHWIIAEQLLLQLTISSVFQGQFEVSEVVDIDKLVRFCNRLLRFRDHFPLIKEYWLLFAELCGEGKKDITKFKMSMQDLAKVKKYLQLDDISDGVLIDMLGCSTRTVQGDLFNFNFSPSGLSVDIKDFAEVLGQLGELD